MQASVIEYYTKKEGVYDFNSFIYFYSLGSISLRHGLYQKWSEQGILLAELNYNKGFRHGICKTFRANGTMRYNYVYDNGKIIDRSLWNKKR